MIGKMLGNRYEILEKIGGGGMAIVYKGRDTFLNRLVTIKILRPEFTSDEDFVARFRREAQAVASLSHANIVNIHDVGHEDGIYYLVMEYVQGDNLKNVIKQKGFLQPAEAVRIAVQVSEALEHAHRNNIVHRDVKPHNILITSEGKAKLTDFGIAMEATSGTITRSDTIMGSVHYLSPEQARGETATARSDIYAVGILLYEMLTGKQPYSGDSPIAVALKHIQETPPPVDEVNPDVPAELAAVVKRAMDKKPGERCRSAMEMARRLEASLEDTEQNTVIIPVVGQDQPPGTRYKKETGGGETGDPGDKQREPLIPRTWTWIGVAMLIVGLLAGVVYGFINYMDVPAVEVHNVVGKNKDEARAELEAQGLEVKFEEEFSEEEEGIVIAQDHGPEDPKVKPPRVITLTVSKGPELKEVPKLVNLTISEAHASLAANGLTMAQPPIENFSDVVEKGRIIKQSPPAGKLVSKNTKVDVTVSMGPEPSMQTMPDLRGKTLNEARDMLAGKNLELIDVGTAWEESTEYMRHQIISQTPEPDTEVEEGTEVRVVLSSGPGPVAKQITVDATDLIPDDGHSHRVEIVVIDSEGRKVGYADSHTAGERVREKVSYRGSGVVQVLIDGDIAAEDELS